MSRLPRILPNFRRTPTGIVPRLTRPVAWRPMTDEEWEAVMHFMAYVHPGPGRYTLLGARRSLDACFHAACSDRPWRELPAVYGNPDSTARLFRRWAHAGLWKRLLTFVAKERAGLQAIQYWVCRAFRRAWRIHGLPGLTFARRLGMDSALRAASWLLPDKQMGDYLREVMLPRWRANMRDWVDDLDLVKRMHDIAKGRRTLPRHLLLSTQERECPDYFELGWEPNGVAA